MCINICTNCTPKIRNEEEEVLQHENERREWRNENSYLMVIAIIRNSVNVNVKKMSRSRITLLNTKSSTDIVVLLKHCITHFIFTLWDQVKSPNIQDYENIQRVETWA